MNPSVNTKAFCTEHEGQPTWSTIILCLRSISRVAQKLHCIHDFALILGFLSRTKSFRRVDSLLKHIPHQDLSFLWIGAKFRFPVQVKKISDEWIRFEDILPHQNPEHCHYSSNECDGWNGVQCLARQHSQEWEILEKSCCDRRSAKAWVVDDSFRSLDYQEEVTFLEASSLCEKVLIVPSVLCHISQRSASCALLSWREDKLLDLGPRILDLMMDDLLRRSQYSFRD